MQDSLLPLFPLEVVLLPGATMPLHIFEDRYKEMIGESLQHSREFGIVQARDKGILNIGCSAVVHEVLNRYPDGRMDIVVLGRRRFEIMFLDQEKSYLRAAVSFFDDEDATPPPAELTSTALASLKLLDETDEESHEAEAAEARLSFRIGDRIPDLQFRQLLLSLRSETDRLKQITAYMPSLIARLRRTAHVKRIARNNGHGMTAEN
jgi:Lon protease-like protein